MKSYIMCLTLNASLLSLFRKTLKVNRKWHRRPFTILFRGESFLATRSITARDRGHAVYQAVQYYWAQLESALGPIGKILTIDDPYEEVVYTPEFACSDRKNNYLTAEVKSRIIVESHGILAECREEGTRHHPPRSLQLVKRRRKLPFRVKPHIYTDANGTLFYSITIQSRVLRAGQKYHKRKVKLVRLKTRDLDKVSNEVEKRGLLKEHLRHSRKRVRSRFDLS